MMYDEMRSCFLSCLWWWGGQVGGGEVAKRETSQGVARSLELNCRLLLDCWRGVEDEWCCPRSADAVSFSSSSPEGEPENRFSQQSRQNKSKMRSSVSERSLIIESDDDDDDHPQSRSSAAARSRRRHHQQEEDSAAGSDSDSGSSSSSCGTPRGPATDSSYTQQWPQSYRSKSLLPFFAN